MKNNITLTVIFFLAVLVGCTKEMNVTVSEDRNEITFTLDGTKAVTDTQLSSLDGGFRVAAVNDATDSVIFNNVVKKSGTVWKDENTKYYYPLDGTTSFYAVYPAEQPIRVKNGRATLLYDATGCSTDLVIAMVRDVNPRRDALPLAFKHLLSKLTIKCKGPSGKICTIKGIDITAPEEGFYVFENDLWTNGNPKSYTCFSGAVALNASSFVQVSEAMTFLPGKVTVRIRWTATVGDITEELEDTFTVNLKRGDDTTLTIQMP